MANTATVGSSASGDMTVIIGDIRAMVKPVLDVLPSTQSQRAHRLRGSLCLYIALSVVFLTAATAKTLDHRQLEATLSASRLVPMTAVPLAAAFLLVMEYLLGLLLLFPTTRQHALHAASVLVSVFMAYSIWRWMQGIPIPCTCFGILLKLEPWQSMLLNATLLGIIGRLLTVGDIYKARSIDRAQEYLNA